MVIETSEFRLKDGIIEEQLRVASAKAQAGFLSQQAGYVGRELFKQEDGMYLDIVWFETNEAAKNALAGFAGHPATKDFEDIIDPASAAMKHWQCIKKY